MINARWIAIFHPTRLCFSWNRWTFPVQLPLLFFILRSCECKQWNSSEPRNKPGLTIPLNPGCLFGILTMVYYNPLYTLNKQFFILHCWSSMLNRLIQTTLYQHRKLFLNSTRKEKMPSSQQAAKNALRLLRKDSITNTVVVPWIKISLDIKWLNTVRNSNMEPEKMMNFKSISRVLGFWLLGI